MPSQEKNVSTNLEWRPNRIPDTGDERLTSSSFETAGLPRHFFDASLLFRCMDMLQVDQSDLARDDPLLFRELQGVCALCHSKEECARDLAHQFDDTRWNRWSVYCPNSTILTTIGAVQNCGHAAQHLKMPLSTTLSHLR